MSNNSTNTEEIVLEDNQILCVLTGEAKKSSPKEENLQSTIRMLNEEYGFDIFDMQRDFTINYVDPETMKNKKQKVELVIFDKDAKHEQENIIRKTDYTYETWGHTSTLSFPKTNSTIVSKYNTDGKLLEIVYSDSHGEINTYDDRGNLIRTKQIDGTIDKPAMTEYDYNEHDLLVEKREYYNIGELSGKTVYEYDTNGLLAQTQVYDLLSRDRPETHFIYEYSDSNRVVKKYRIGDEGNKELESWCKREYYPNGKLKTVVRNSIVQEKYDEQGRPIDERPGFEILYKDFQDYGCDANGNWIETKNFKDYVDFGTGLGRILKPYVERIFTYYKE